MSLRVKSVSLFLLFVPVQNCTFALYVYGSYVRAFDFICAHRMYILYAVCCTILLAVIEMNT